MRRFFFYALFAAAPVLDAHAQGLRAVRLLPGYSCMMLSAPPAATVEAIRQVPVRAEPSVSAPVTGISPTVVLMANPLVANGAFLQATFADHHTGWIAASDLKPWSTPYNPGQRCIPSVMSNGTYGFDFR